MNYYIADCHFGHAAILNLDHRPFADLQQKFTDIADYKEIHDNGRHVILCHYPIPFYKRSNNPDHFMLCGHVHNTKESEYLEKWTAELKAAHRDGEAAAHANNCGQIINVGCMKPWMGYTPRTLDELIQKV